MKKRILIFLFISLCSQSFSQNIIDHKVDSIISLMTLNEKIAQMYNNSFMTTPDNTRLNIPGFIMDDGPHGVRFQTATSFPGGITMAATWDTNLGFDIARAMAEEFHSFGKHQQLGPVMDLCRDPRNGRSAESGGEDPYLIGVMGAYYVKGLQSTPVMATIKHYNANFREKNRYDNSYTLSYRQLMEHNGFNFRYPMQEGGAFSIMNAYNKINGQKCAENDTLLNLILRKHWGFPFYVVSDWGSIYAPQADIKKAVLAGCNVEMGSDLYKNNIAQMITAGTLTEANINASVKTIIKTK
ncbi:MAG: glycoside hydrolase family 3 protein, partial [Cytophagales bacterium]|nr:glycoside hydrolase family 3 protein [Cytophaga sp.]